MEEWVNALISKEPFSFSRWGDGEWNCIFGVEGWNCDDHIYYKDMGERLLDVLLSEPEYYLGEHAMAMRLMGDKIRQAIAGLSLNWVNADTLHLKSIDGTIKEYIDIWKTRDVVLVGPQHLKKLDLFPFRFIEIPSKNCWLEYESILEEIKKEIWHDTVVLFCASMMANVLIDDLHGHCTLIDAGSLFDPYVGIFSRSHHKYVKLKI